MKNIFIFLFFLISLQCQEQQQNDTIHFQLEIHQLEIYGCTLENEQPIVLVNDTSSDFPNGILRFNTNDRVMILLMGKKAYLRSYATDFLYKIFGNNYLIYMQALQDSYNDFYTLKGTETDIPNTYQGTFFNFTAIDEITQYNIQDFLDVSIYKSESFIEDQNTFLHLGKKTHCINVEFTSIATRGQLFYKMCTAIDKVIDPILTQMQHHFIHQINPYFKEIDNIPKPDYQDSFKDFKQSKLVRNKKMSKKLYDMYI